MDCPICQELANLPPGDESHIHKEDIADGKHECIKCHRRICGWHSSPTPGGRICDDCSTSV